MKHRFRVFDGARLRSKKSTILMVTAIAVLFGLLGGPGARAQGPKQTSSSGNPASNPKQNLLPAVPSTEHSAKTNQKQKQAMADDSFNRLKKHASDLAELAKSLQKEIAATNENVLSLKIIRKTRKIQKLAKKIENEAERD